MLASTSFTIKNVYLTKFYTFGNHSWCYSCCRSILAIPETTFSKHMYIGKHTYYFIYFVVCVDVYALNHTLKKNGMIYICG